MSRRILIAALRPILAAFVTCAAFAQTAEAPSFEVASIKPSARTAGNIVNFPPGGAVFAEIAVKYLIQAAYGVETYQIVGGPGWIETQRYLIEAKAADPAATRQDRLLMLRSLLADRFRLKLRKEMRDVPVFELVAGKNGPKIPLLKDGEPSKCGPRNSFVCGITSMSVLARSLRGYAGRPVLDKTGLQGQYDVLLDFDVSSASGGTSPPDLDKPSLPQALQDQLGLKLQDAKVSMAIYVIDSIERPTDN